jgi:hypothetical protein
MPFFRRMVAKVVVKMAYGIELKSEDDEVCAKVSSIAVPNKLTCATQYIRLADTAMSYIVRAGLPGQFLVNVFPIRRTLLLSTCSKAEC